MSKVHGSITFTGDIDDFISKARNAMDDNFVQGIARQTELFRKLGGMSEVAIQAETARCRALWAADRERCLAEMRANMAGVPAGEIMDFMESTE